MDALSNLSLLYFYEHGPSNSPSKLSLVKTSSTTKNGAILGCEGMNTISIASTQHGDFVDEFVAEEASQAQALQ
jgi:hypothetical protein